LQFFVFQLNLPAVVLIHELNLLKVQSPIWDIMLGALLWAQNALNSISLYNQRAIWIAPLIIGHKLE
jgi:hypothetical protein